MDVMMKFLIATEPDDTHAILVKIALEESGKKVRCIFTADHPTQQKNSIFIDNQRLSWLSADDYNSISECNYDVVWWRRPRKPFLPKHEIHPEDYPFVVKENHLFFESLPYLVNKEAWWINPIDAHRKANSKILQLSMASQCGLTIPITLCSNSPTEIKDFLLKNKNNVIYKCFCSHFWSEKDQIKLSYTSAIDWLKLPSNQTLQRSPGIFQVHVQKKYELRVTCFGNYIVAAKLNSQSHADGQLDWRAIPFKEMSVEPYFLPDEITKKIKLFMQKLGIVFGCFDFIVTPDNQYVFLEVNEQGQFLWLEEYNPDLKMLDIFTQFMLVASTYYEWNPKNFYHSLEKYREQMDTLMSQNITRHINLNYIPLANEVTGF